MALENAAIAKLVGGFAVAGGSVGTGIYYREAIFNAFKNAAAASEDDFYVVVAKTSATSDLPTDEPNHTSPNRNYKCKSNISGDLEDNECEIYKLPAKVDNKLNDLTKILEEKTIPKKSDITANTHFKLKIKNKLFTKELSETITIFSTKTDEKTKKYGEFTVSYKIQDKQFVGKTNLLIASTTTSVTVDIASGDTFECKLKNEDDSLLKACTLYKFTTQTTGTGKHKDLSFESNNVSSSSITKADISSNKFVAIKLADDKSLSDLKANVTVVYVKKTGNNNKQQIAEFTFITGLAKDANFATSTNTFFLS